MYEVKVSSAAKKDIRRLSPAVRKVLKEVYIPKIQIDPYIAESLRYELKGLWSYHFS
ncbi:MAG: type II toxin-antitoxin system RelE family toxin [Anaerolineae bacterium]